MSATGSGRVAVLGGGSWGTVLALVAAANSPCVRVWCRDSEQAAAVEGRRENARYLPGVALPETVRFTELLEEAVEGAGLVIVAVPVVAIRPVLRRHGKAIPGEALLLSAAKGLERETFARVSQILEAELPAGAKGRLAAMSGPNLAREMAAGKPTAAVVAAIRPETASAIQRWLSTPALRLYTSTDVAGVELGGALKNIIAIGAGIVHGLGLGANAIGTLLTRGLAEMTRLGVRQGAKPLTFNGLSGVGDLVATCVSPLSRNRSVGEGVARGETVQAILARLGMVAEGIPTTAAVHAFATKLQVPMPITEAIHSVLFEGMDARSAVVGLMTRDLRSEDEFL